MQNGFPACGYKLSRCGVQLHQNIVLIPSLHYWKGRDSQPKTERTTAKSSSYHLNLIGCGSALVSRSALSMAITSRRGLRIAVVGDIHEHWDAEADGNALEALRVDLVLFVGDLGNEDPEYAKAVMKLTLPKAVILGNHDSWWTTGPFRNNREGRPDGIQPQLDVLGKAHVGFSRLDLPSLNVSVVGGRPFSSGGKVLEKGALSLYKQRYGVTSLAESAQKIVAAAQDAPFNHHLIFLSHNGPSGLGDRPDDIVGRDWEDEHGPPGGDFGDRDFETALSTVRSNGQPVPLVVFGHMHNLLCIPGTRKMVKASPDETTVFVNAAVVPRVRPFTRTRHVDRSGLRSVPAGPEDMQPLEDSRGNERNFTVVTLEDGKVTMVEEVWVLVRESEKAKIAESIILYRRGTRVGA
eukprot:TRINITY_DN19195_c0_g1_i1.p1 TRINITY_DN19195_c0_g1~~TRINITY_DN19195_c0_g1_i1.p1  ORF type:complete len:408 (+),score=68.48 TRINITY_DN19195_c0_g1_i1:53-1276(+)